PDLDAAQHAGVPVDVPDGAEVPLQALADGAQQARVGLGEGGGLGQDVADGLVGGPPPLGPVALRDGGAEQKAGDGEDGHEGLHEDGPLVDGAAAERAEAVDGPPDGDGRGGQGDGGAAALAEAQGGPDDEGEDDVFERVVGGDQREPAGEDDQAGED